MFIHTWLLFGRYLSSTDAIDWLFIYDALLFSVRCRVGWLGQRWNVDLGTSHWLDRSWRGRCTRRDHTPESIRLVKWKRKRFCWLATSVQLNCRDQLNEGNEATEKTSRKEEKRNKYTMLLWRSSTVYLHHQGPTVGSLECSSSSPHSIKDWTWLDSLSQSI